MEYNKRKRSQSVHSLLQRIKVFIISNSAPVRTRRSNTVNGRLIGNNDNNKHTLRKYKSSTDITNLDTQQSWTQVTKLYTLCLEPSDGPPVSPKYMQKDHHENWWSQTPTLQSMA